MMIATPASGASPVTTDSVFWAPGDCIGACELFDVTDGGDFVAATGIATIERSPGQIAWDHDLSNAYVSEFSQNRVLIVSASREVATYATGILRPTGLLRTADDRLLVASFSNGAVGWIVSRRRVLKAGPRPDAEPSPRAEEAR
jgi:DNA-binding beta-propeller fold protein YncE